MPRSADKRATIHNYVLDYTALMHRLPTARNVLDACGGSMRTICSVLSEFRKHPRAQERIPLEFPRFRPPKGSMKPQGMTVGDLREALSGFHPKAHVLMEWEYCASANPVSQVEEVRILQLPRGVHDIMQLGVHYLTAPTEDIHKYEPETVGEWEVARNCKEYRNGVLLSFEGQGPPEGETE